LLALSANVSSAQNALGQASALAKMSERSVAEDARKKAVQAAIDAAKEAKKHADDGGMFSCITDHIGVVGLVGLCTGQYYLVAEDLIAHAAQSDNHQTSILGAAAAFAGPLGSGLELAIEKGLPEDWTRPMEELPQIKDDDVRVANKVALTVVMAQAMAAATVATGGLATPTYIALAGMAVSCATEVGDESGATRAVFKSDADKVTMGGRVTGAVLSAAGAVAGVSGVWSGISAAGRVVSTTAEVGNETGLTKKIFKSDAANVSLGMSIGGAAIGVVGAAGAAVTATGAEAAKKANDDAKVASRLKDAKQIVDGADTARRGIIGLERAHYEHEADLDNVEATRQKQLMRRIEMAIDGIIDDLKEAQKSSKRATQTIQGAIQTAQQTTLLAIGMKG
jgi:hypothetical protein